MIKKLLSFIFLLHTGLITVHAQFTKVQIINNIPDVSVNGIDVYVNGSLTVTNLQFRFASGSINLPAGSPVNIGIALSPSTNANDTFKNFVTTFSPIDDYYLVFNGIKSTSGYTPLKPLSMNVFTGAHANSGSGTLDILCFNGSTDAPAHDLRTGVKMLSDDVTYGSYTSSYAVIPAIDGKIRMTNTKGNVHLKSYDAPFSFYAGKAGLLVVSGFDKPSSNSNGPSLGLWFATSDAGPLTEFYDANAEPIARGQFIHNCADTTADTVDIYVDDVKVADDFRYKNATAFMDFLAKTTVTIKVAPHSSTSSADAFYTLPTTLDSAGTYMFVANGIQSSAGYTPSPSYRLSRFGAREDAANTANTDALFVNGCTDGNNMTLTDYPAANTWASGVAFGNAGSNYYAAATANHTLKLAYGSTTSYYLANFQSLGWTGQAVTILASGFVDSTVNSKGPKLGLWAVPASGGAFTKLPPTTVGISSLSGQNINVRTYPVPAHDILYVSADKHISSASVYDMHGKLIKTYTSINNKIDISNIASGNYFLQITTEGQVNKQVLQFIKE